MSFIPPAGGSPPHRRVGGQHDGKNMMGSHFSGSERESGRERGERVRGDVKEAGGVVYAGRQGDADTAGGEMLKYSQREKEK